jgi:hypothetical protein
MMREFKFFKGQSKELVFLPDDRERLPLDERWMWIDEPRIPISDFDYNTGAIIDIVHNATNYYGTFSDFIGNVILDSRLFYIFDITMYANGEITHIPEGTTFGQMGVYDWSANFRIIAVVV